MFKPKLKTQWLISFRWDNTKGGGYGNMLQDFEPIFEDVIKDIITHSKDKGCDLTREGSFVSILSISKIKTRQ